MTQYETITAITQMPSFIAVAVLIWILPIIIYITFGGLFKGKSKTNLLSKPNFWHFLWNWVLIQGFLIAFGIIFPIWALLLN